MRLRRGVSMATWTSTWYNNTALLIFTLTAVRWWNGTLQLAVLQLALEKLLIKNSGQITSISTTITNYRVNPITNYRVNRWNHAHGLMHVHKRHVVAGYLLPRTDVYLQEARQHPVFSPFSVPFTVAYTVRTLRCSKLKEPVRGGCCWEMPEESAIPYRQ